MYGATHQNKEVLSHIAYVIAGVIDLPVLLLYGVDSSHQPPILVSIAIYLAEAGIISLFVYIILFTRKKRS